jgi:transcriptional regulator with XRE-family HTH domain
MPAFEAAEQLGEALRTARERCGISLRECARRTGLSPSYTSEVERGAIAVPPNEATIIHMADVLGASDQVDA